jgi:hypothetical protein
VTRPETVRAPDPATGEALEPPPSVAGGATPAALSDGNPLGLPRYVS